MNKEALQKKNVAKHDIFSPRLISLVESRVFSYSLRKQGFFDVVPIGVFNCANDFTAHALPYEWLKQNNLQHAQPDGMGVNSSNTVISHVYGNNTVNIFDPGMVFRSLVNKNIRKHSSVARHRNKRYLAADEQGIKGLSGATTHMPTSSSSGYFGKKLFHKRVMINSREESKFHEHSVANISASKYKKHSILSRLINTPDFYCNRNGYRNGNDIFGNELNCADSNKFSTNMLWGAISTANINPGPDNQVHIEKQLRRDAIKNNAAQRASVQDAINTLASNSSNGQRENIQQLKAVQQQLKDAEQVKTKEMYDLRQSIAELKNMMSTPKLQASFVPASFSSPPSFYGRIK